MDGHEGPFAEARQGAYVGHATTAAHPLLRLGLFRGRTFRTAIAGSFVTRLGVGGLPFLLPLLYQVGLGYNAVESGLLILPQSFAAMSLRLAMPKLLSRFGYRRVLLVNTVAVGVLIGLFALVGPRTPVWLIAAQAFCFGFFSSFQYTSMNTLAYADIAEPSLRAYGPRTRRQFFKLAFSGGNPLT